MQFLQDISVYLYCSITVPDNAYVGLVEGWYLLGIVKIMVLVVAGYSQVSQYTA